MPDQDSSPPKDIQPGQWVEVQGMNRVGQVIRVWASRGRAEVAIHDQNWQIALDRLSPCEQPEAAKDLKTMRSMIQTPNTESRYELDLHGMRVEEAIEAVDQFLDQAVVNGLTLIKIIHGHGGGRVRSALREYLSAHPRVKGFQFGAPPQGGLAVTMVSMK